MKLLMLFAFVAFVVACSKPEDPEPDPTTTTTTTDPGTTNPPPATANRDSRLLGKWYNDSTFYEKIFSETDTTFIHEKYNECSGDMMDPLSLTPFTTLSFSDSLYLSFVCGGWTWAEITYIFETNAANDSLIYVIKGLYNTTPKNERDRAK
jgi:hypothetical protein